MSSSSKLDYLSKYYSSSSAAADHHAEKSQKKEKKKKRSRSENQSTAGTLQIIDDQSDMLPRPLIHRDRFQKMEKEENESLHRRKRFDSSDSESESDTEEDGPLVVQLDNRSSDVQLPQTMSSQLHKQHHHHHSKKQRRYDSDDDDAAADKKRGQQQTQNDTVYRDKQGKKLNIKDEQDKHQKQVQESLELQQKQKILLNMGGAQKALIEARSTEFKDIQQSSFARGIDDEQLEDWRRNQIRDGDPMASYMSSSKNAASSSKQSNQDTLLQQHPRYKGPTPKPNRFLLPPGYRWDGVDRGNGFEDLVLAKTNVKSQEREDAYKRSTADM